MKIVCALIILAFIFSSCSNKLDKNNAVKLLRKHLPLNDTAWQVRYSEDGMNRSFLVRDYGIISISEEKKSAQIVFAVAYGIRGYKSISRPGEVDPMGNVSPINDGKNSFQYWAIGKDMECASCVCESITCKLIKTSGGWNIENMDEVQNKIYNPACAPDWNSFQHMPLWWKK
jgi:hypothetical protein